MYVCEIGWFCAWKENVPFMFMKVKLWWNLRETNGMFVCCIIFYYVWKSCLRGFLKLKLQAGLLDPLFDLFLTKLKKN